MLRKTTQVLIISFLILSSISQPDTISAGINVWTSNRPGGENINALVVDPATPTTLYAGTGGGVLKSINGGGNWSPVNTGLTNAGVTALAIDPATPSTLYAGTENGGVFRSTDGGANWSQVNSGLTASYVKVLTIDPKTPGTLYAGTKGGGVFVIHNLK